MNFKEQKQFKREKIRNLWIYQHLSVRDIAAVLNGDPEFIRKCGKIAYPTVQYHLKKIKAEFEFNVDNDGLERFTAEFGRSVEFMDGEISDVTKILEDKSLKPDERLKFMNMRHRMEVDKMTLLSDREIPLTVRKYKKDRQAWAKTLNKAPEDPPNMIDVTTIPNTLINRVSPKEEE